MNCQEFLRLLVANGERTAAAEAHLGSCSSCRNMLQSLAAPAAEVPPARVAAIQELVLSSLAPVRPLASNRLLAVRVLLASVVLAVLCAYPFGYFALRAISAAELAVYYSVILALSVLFSFALTQDMIPGAKRSLNRSLLIGGTFVVLAVVVIVLFRTFAIPRFVTAGMGCLRLGVMSALVAGVAAWWWLRRGFITTPVKTCCLAGTYAGLVGFAMLALHCPLQQAPHILMWHLGTVAISAAAGALIGTAFQHWAA